ncbi:hypothetical protein FNF31_04788 [Cafeteria roenbergensis]|uniref:Topoisomerase 6 subunit A/Spo11 TOPRIM domain-containing protein n=1 Tax=Cafeteria roenbergensis TaxID=33653 RepID=A0A5A8D3Q3_CAFRO|nr:hypothetical protein FNF31_04788 [Cafeteria roenbergensis]
MHPPEDSLFCPQASGRVAFVLVVEKDCIFHRLAQDGLPQKSRCAMVTGKGMPDLAARAMTWRLATRFKCPVVALTDCNPSGMNVALAYKLACKSSTLPSADEEQFKVSQLAWLGLSPFDLDVVDPSAVLPLSSRDRTLAANLAARDSLPPSWADCAREMLDADRKAELESLYTSGGGVGGVMAYVLRKLRDQEWLL